MHFLNKSQFIVDRIKYDCPDVRVLMDIFVFQLVLNKLPLQLFIEYHALLNEESRIFKLKRSRQLPHLVVNRLAIDLSTDIQQTTISTPIYHHSKQDILCRK